MVETGHFLFGIPNTIRRLSMNKLFLYGWLTLVVGLLSLANAAVATGLEAVKSYHITQYVNTHWITTFFIISGGATMLVDKLRIDFFLFTAVCANFISIFISVGAMIFDCANLHMMTRVDFSGSYIRMMQLSSLQRRAMLAYAIIDIICCTATFWLSLLTCYEIRSIANRYFSNMQAFRSKVLLFLGFCLCFIGVSKQILWICELKWLIGIGESARFMFLNYTMDEPVWNCIYLLTGVLNCFTAWKGARTWAYCALPLTALSAYPAIHYLWIDYRWMLTVQLTEITMEVPRPERVLRINIAATVIHLVIIAATVVQLCRIFSDKGLPWTTVSLEMDASLRKAILFTGILLFFSGCAFFITDIVNIQAGTFYRLFYPSEQKLPFFLIPSGVLCLLVLRNHNVGPYFVPCLLILLLLTFHATIFHISTYVYLTSNVYFGQHLCELFFYFKHKCTKRVEEIGAVAHFMEAALAVSVLALSLYASILFGRLSGFYTLACADKLNADEKKSQRKATCRLRTSLCIQLLLGLGSFLVCVLVRENAFQDHDHPLFFIHGTIQRVCFSLVLIIFPGVQLALSGDLHKFPIKTLAQLSVCCIRITDVLMQVDYRNVANLGIGWTVMTSVELFSLVLHSVSFVQCAILLDLGMHRLPEFDVLYEPGASSSSPGATGRTEDHSESGWQPVATADSSDAVPNGRLVFDEHAKVGAKIESANYDHLFIAQK